MTKTLSQTSPRGLVPSGASDVVYQEFLDKLHVRDKDSTGQIVREALASSGDPRFRAFLEYTMGGNPRLSLAHVAKQCQIDMLEFQAFWRDARVNQSINKAIDNLPVLTQDMIDDARTDETTCPACDGTGQIEREGKPAKICANCLGKGVVRTVGDKHSRDKLLEMTGVIKKEAPVQVNLNMRGIGMEAAAAKLNKAVPFDLDIEAETVDIPADPE